MIADLLLPVGEAVLDQMPDHGRRVGQIVEKRLQLFVEERQPMLHAGEAPALAHRLVERVVAEHGAEGGAIALAEAADRLLRQHRLARRDELEVLHLPRRALRRRIEGPDRLQRVAKEIETDRGRGAGREEIEDAAAHRVFADLAHGRGAVEAVGLQEAQQAFHRDDIAGCREKRPPRDALPVRHALHDGVGGGEDDAWAGMRCEQRVERTHPVCGDFRIGRDAVVGKAVPGREGERRNCGREKAERRLGQRNPARVAGDVEDRPLRFRQARQHAAFQPVRHAAKRDRAAAAEEARQRIGRGKQLSFLHGPVWPLARLCEWKSMIDWKTGVRYSCPGSARPVTQP